MILGYDQGRASRQPEIDRAIADANRLYGIAFDHPDRARQRFDAAAERYWTDFMAGLIELTDLSERKAA